MTVLRPLPAPLTTLVERVRAWPVDSQQVARRNAMLACTALTARRVEREDVEEFFRSLAAAPAAVVERPLVARG